MITVDGRIFDTDFRWDEYCEEHNIADPFKEQMDRIKIERVVKDGVEGWESEWDDSPEEQAWQADWKKRRDEYLRLMHTFRLWDMHFWMDNWEQFQRMGKGGYVDMSIYMPCDIASRQCSMTCAYFGTECPRARGEELKSPIEGVEGRYEYHESDRDNGE